MPAAKPPEFRRRAIELVHRGHQSVPQVAKDLGISESCLQRWVAIDDVDRSNCPSSKVEDHPASLAMTGIFTSTSRAPRAGASLCSDHDQREQISCDALRRNVFSRAEIRTWRRSDRIDPSGLEDVLALTHASLGRLRRHPVGADIG